MTSMDFRIRKRLKHYFFAAPKKYIYDRRILLDPSRAPGTEASQLLNEIISVKNYSGKYLEIGVERGLTFEGVNIKEKFAVDPHILFNRWVKNSNAKLFEVTSDEFFEKGLHQNTTFDLIYLDGLHTFEQTYRDLENSFRLMNSNSLLVIDDTVPSDIFSANPIQHLAYQSRIEAGLKNDGSWHGDTFKVVCALSQLQLPGVNFRTLVDLQNPKTVIWLSRGFDWPKELPAIHTYSLGGFTYQDYFMPHISKVFNPVFKNIFLEEISGS